jgi:hypothetical protein
MNPEERLPKLRARALAVRSLGLDRWKNEEELIDEALALAREFEELDAHLAGGGALPFRWRPGARGAAPGLAIEDHREIVDALDGADVDGFLEAARAVVAGDHRPAQVKRVAETAIILGESALYLGQWARRVVDWFGRPTPPVPGPERPAGG